MQNSNRSSDDQSCPQNSSACPQNIFIIQVFLIFWCIFIQVSWSLVLWTGWTWISDAMLRNWSQWGRHEWSISYWRSNFFHLHRLFFILFLAMIITKFTVQSAANFDIFIFHIYKISLSNLKFSFCESILFKGKVSSVTNDGKKKNRVHMVKSIWWNGVVHKLQQKQFAHQLLQIRWSSEFHFVCFDRFNFLLYTQLTLLIFQSPSCFRVLLK